MRGERIICYITFLFLMLCGLGISEGLDIPASEYSIDELTKGVDKKEVNKEVEEIEKIKKNHEIQKEAQEINNTINSKDYKEKIEGYIVDFYNHIGVDKYYPDLKNNMSVPNNALDSKIYIFISSSVPTETIRNYVKSVVKYGLEKDTVFVLRGFIGNDISKVKPTLEFIKKIIYIDPSCDTTKSECGVYKIEVNIDPLVFNRLKIKKVPALGIISNIKMTDSAQSIGKEDNADFSYRIIYGDARLEYLLNRLYEETKDENVKKYIEKIGG